jgi:hypothetical protein
MASPLVGTETVEIATASGSVISAAASNAKAVALLAQAIPARVNTPIATAGNGTLSAAALVGAVVTRSGTSGNFTDTTDTAANIILALPTEAPINTSWDVYVRNVTPYSQTVAAGTGVTLVGNTVIPPNSTGIFKLVYTGAASVTLIGTCVTPTDLGVVEVNTPITTVGAGTLNAATVVGGVITRSGPTAAYTDTTDTAANIIAALPNPSLGQSWELTLVNTTAFAETLAAGAGVTIAGLAGPIPANSSARALCTYSGAGAVTVALIEIHYNAASGKDPSTKQTAFGGGSGTFRGEGLLYTEFDSTAVNPGGTAVDSVLSVFTIPASTFDQAGRGVSVKAKGSFAANGNTKRLKVIANPTAAVVGSAVTGGTTIADSGAVTTSGGGWEIEGEVFKYGAGGTNTQMASGKFSGAAAVQTAPQLLTATESGAILVAICGNAATAATDIALSQVVARASN